MTTGQVSSTDHFDLARTGLADDHSADAALWENLDLTDTEDRRFGDYDLLELIGRGGMGVVFRATQLSLGREVAIKFIVAGLADDVMAVQRFRLEACAAAKLHHPNIVPVYEVGSIDGMHFFSMPLLTVQTLAQRLDSSPLSESASVLLLIDLAAAVDYAHMLGLLHLDIKPANVLFDEHGRAMISDFGLARHMDEGGVVTRSEISGTPGYMAPEQEKGDGRSLDRRTDVYALGCVLQELVASYRPPADLAAICDNCLKQAPEQRYQSAGELAADLMRYRDGNSVSVRKAPWHELVVRSVRRHPTLSLALIAGLAAMIIGLATTTWQRDRADRALVEAARQQALTQVQVVRSQRLAGLMAAAFPANENAEYANRANSARSAVAWLKATVGKDPGAQRDILTAFRDALADAGKHEGVDALMHEIVDQLGEDFRLQQVTRLLARGDRDSLIAAGLIGIPVATDVPSPAHEATLLRLLQEHPDDELALYVAALACHVQVNPCRHGEFQQQLTAKFPGNAVHWLLTPSGSNLTVREFKRLISRAGDALTFDDRHATYHRILLDAVRDQPIPDSIREPIQAVLLEAEVDKYLRSHLSWNVPHPEYSNLVRTCMPETKRNGEQDEILRNCGRLAILGMRSPTSSIVSRMVSGAIVRRIYKGQALEREAWEYRRQYVWLGDHGFGSSESEDVLQRDTAEFGEWEAWQRRTERLGYPRVPPVGWLPGDPQKLLLHEDRKPLPEPTGAH